jgi:DNA primase
MVSLLASLGIEDVRDRGSKEISARCPAHEQRSGEREHRPDHWSINRHTGLHRCWSCGYSGSLVKLVMDMTGLGLWDAQKFIRQHNVETDRADVVDIANVVSALQVTATLEADYASFTDPPERALRRRKIDLNSCAHFGVRWEEGQPLGTWILPIRHPSSGTLWGWQRKRGRRVENHPEGVRKSLTLFGLHLLQPGSLAVLTESPLDTLVVHRHGYQAVAAFGAEVSDAQLRLIQERTIRLCIALDNDTAGWLSTQRLLFDRRVAFNELLVLSYRHTTAKDPGEMTADELDFALQMAVPAREWLIDPGRPPEG